MDYASATPMLPEVVREMEKYFSREFYNPNAIYEEGVRVSLEVMKFRSQIAKILGVAKESIIFTSGGTEANVLAIRGVKNAKVFIEEESHPSVFDTAKDLPKAPTWQKATLVSSVTTDNKLGREIREERKKKNSDYPLLHIDASQTANYFDIKLEALACDILTLDSAKLYGPKGIGALIVRKGVKLDLPPQGTPPVPLIAGMAKALEITLRDKESERKRLTSLSARFAEIVQEKIPEAEVSVVAPNIVNVSVPSILPEFLVLALDRAGVLVSAGPACDAHKPEPPETPVRFSFGRFTTEKELKEAAKIFCSTAQNLIK